MSHRKKKEVVLDEDQIEQKPAEKVEENEEDVSYYGGSRPSKAKKPTKKRASAGGEAGPSRPAKKKPGNCETCGRSPKKKPTAAALAKQARGGNDTTCVKTCKKGNKSGCTTRGKGKPTGNLSCKEVDRRLKALGVDAATASLCVKSAIQSGIIEITGEDKEELNQVVHSEEHNCGHTIEATLGDLLRQPDYGGNDYESGLQDATVRCKELVEEEDEDGNTVQTMCGDLEEEDGRTYVSEICQGQFRFDCGKFHNHCTKCPGFGMCIGDYREAHCNKCKKHYYAGGYGTCGCGSKGKKRWGMSRRGFGGFFGLGL